MNFQGPLVLTLDRYFENAKGLAVAVEPVSTAKETGIKCHCHAVQVPAMTTPHSPADVIRTLAPGCHPKIDGYVPQNIVIMGFDGFDPHIYPCKQPVTVGQVLRP